MARQRKTLRARYRRTTDYTPVIPNRDSPLSTPSSKLLDLHYANLLLIERWSWDRYIKLCEFLKMTPAELASLVLMPHAWLERYEDQNMLDYGLAKGSLAVALILTLIEAHTMQTVTKDVILNPFPNRNKHG